MEQLLDFERYNILMIFNKWKKRAHRFEQYLQEIEDIAVVPK